MGLQVAAEGRVVLAKICACDGCKRRPALDLPGSYCFAYKDPTDPRAKEVILFIPRELTPFGYTQDQIAEIERVLAVFGIDLLPFDHALLN